MIRVSGRVLQNIFLNNHTKRVVFFIKKRLSGWFSVKECLFLQPN